MSQCNLCRLEQIKHDLLYSTSVKMLTLRVERRGAIAVYKHPADVDMEDLTNRQRFKYWVCTLEAISKVCCC